jgi:hypothetical protein
MYITMNSSKNVKSCIQVCTVPVVLCYLITRPWRRKSGGTAPRIYDLGTWWRGVKSFKPRPLYHYLRGNALRYHCIGGWVSPSQYWSGCCDVRVRCPSRAPNPDCPVAHPCRPVTTDWATPAHVTNYIYHNLWTCGRQISRRHDHTYLLLRDVHYHFGCIMSLSI